MRGQSTLPMDKVDVELLSDIIEHFLGDSRESAELLRSERDTVSNGYNPSFDNDDADTIISDLQRIEDRSEGRDLLVGECTSYDPVSDAEASFLDLEVYGYIEMKRRYFEECHDPYW